MSTDAFQKARDKIAFHEAEIRRLKEWIATGEAILADATTTTPAAAEPPSASTAGTIQTVNGRVVFVRSSPTAVVLAEAEAILREAGEPMTAADIYERLVRRGVKIAGNSPKGNLTAKFATRRDVFTFEGKETGLWSLAEWSRQTTQKNEALSEQSESASQVTDEPDRSSIESHSEDDLLG